MKALTVLLVVSLTLGCSQEDSGARRSVEEYAVYSLVIDSLCLLPVYEESANRKLVLIIDSTGQRQMSSTFYVGDMPLSKPVADEFDEAKVRRWLESGISDSVVFKHLETAVTQFDFEILQRDFDSVNNHPQALDSTKFTLPVPYTLMPHAIFSSVIRNQWSDVSSRWTENVKIAHGVVFLSRVGFNATYDQAIVSIYHSSFNEGTDWFVICERNEERWRIKYLLHSMWFPKRHVRPR